MDSIVKTKVGNSASSRDKAYFLHPFTNMKLHQETGPLIIDRGEGVYVFDDSGKRYLEGMAGLWCTSLGYGEQRLIDAATRQMSKLPVYHTFGSKSNEPAIDLAEKLVTIAPAPMSKAFFMNSGSEANDTAIKLVWYYNNALGRPQKKKIISRIRAYHGVTIAAASLTGLPYAQTGFDLPLDFVKHTNHPHFWRFGMDGESEEAFATRMAESLEELILREGPDTIGGFIAEPVMGAGGVYTPPATYFAKIHAVLRKYDILFIADEVICGFGRTGNMFGCEAYGIKPDIMVMAKGLSSGYLPIAAVLINDKIHSAIDGYSDQLGTFGHGYTYSGHPAAAAVALETIRIYEERDIVGHVRRVAPKLQNGLRALQDHPLVGEVRGIGLMAGVELVADKKAKTAFDPALKVGLACFKFAQERGVILRAMVDTVGFCPPLIVNEEHIANILETFTLALDDTAAWLKKQGLAPAA